MTDEAKAAVVSVRLDALAARLDAPAATIEKLRTRVDQLETAGASRSASNEQAPSPNGD